MNNKLEQIVMWLKANGANALDGKNYSFSCEDEPYMDFSAEWQDWDDHQWLLVGYHTIVNGDVCNDPQFAFRIANGEVTKISCDNWFMGPRLIEQEDDVEYARHFAETVYRRHMVSRADNARCA